MRQLRYYLFIVVALFGFTSLAVAFEITEVTSPGGIKAWLVESHSIPIVSMDFSFGGGATLDPAGKDGAASLLSSMLTEGAGDLTSAAFKTEITRLNMDLAFNTDADFTNGSFSCLRSNCDEALAILKLAMTRPRFDVEAFSRVQQLALQSLAQRARDQTNIGYWGWNAKAFPNHVYGRNVSGSPATVTTITPDDLQKLHAQTFNRSTLKVAVVGDIDAATLGQKLDEIFGALPLGEAVPVAIATEIAKGPVLDTIDYDGPQTLIYFGSPSLADDDKRGMAAYLMAEMLGGGATFARLNQSLREKSGLTYGVNFDDIAAPQASYMQGSMSTGNDTAMLALEKLQDELALMAKNGPDDEELRKVKSYVNGSYPLRFTSNASISRTMLAALQKGRPTNFVERREKRVNAVTVADIKLVAAELLKPENQIVVMVGRPKR